MIQDFINTLSFLTIIRLKTKNFNAKKTLLYFPMVGIMLGFGLYGLSNINIPLKGLLQLIFLVVITGALHLDGLADTADSLFSHRSKEKKLEIMKDSRLGTMGTVALFLVLITKIEALSHINNPIMLIIIPAYSRSAMVIGTHFLKYLRKDSISKEFFGHSSFSTFLPIFIPIALSYFCGLYYFAIINALFLLSTFITIKFYKHALGGATGDMIGALCEFTETLLFLASSFLAF